jgi:HK97 family phage portal protein
MTIHLMSNSKTGGDYRVKNELSKHVDVYPNRWQTRQIWMEDIVQTMLIEGDGNAVVVPMTEKGLLGDMIKIAPSRVQLQAKSRALGYEILIDGKPYDPENLLHFVTNPDPARPWKGQGFRVVLSDIAKNLRQAQKTENAFMSSEFRPNLIVKVDALTEEFSSPEGRDKLRNDYLKNGKVGEPWIIPAEQFQVEQIKPLSLNDLAISDTVTLNKKTVAAILGVPAFVLGVGEFNKDAWNNFVSATILPLAHSIEQELTRKLLISESLYFRFNVQSLYAYDLQTTSTVFRELYVRGIVTGNEVRDKIGMTPLDGLDQLVVLENYIPLDKIADQAKLNGGN